MNNLSKYFIYLLLIFTFSLRFVIPVFAGFHYIDIDHLEEKSAEEKCELKLNAFEVEVTDTITLPHGIPGLRPGTCGLLNMQDLFLPVQYFAIPTPPPWRHNSY